MQDKNGNIININDIVKDDKGIEWKLINLHGVSMIAQYENGRRVKTKVLRKVDVGKIEKV